MHSKTATDTIPILTYNSAVASGGRKIIQVESVTIRMSFKLATVFTVRLFLDTQWIFPPLQCPLIWLVQDDRDTVPVPPESLLLSRNGDCKAVHSSSGCHACMIVLNLPANDRGREWFWPE